MRDYVGLRLKFVIVTLLVLAVFVGSVLLSYGVHSIYNAEKKCLTIEEAYNYTDLKGHYIKAVVDTRGELFYVAKNPILGLRNSYYCLVKQKDTDYWIAIRTSKEWIDNFYLNGGQMEIKGDYWTMEGYGVQEELFSLMNSGATSGKVNVSHFVDCYSDYTNVLRFIASLACFLFVFAYIFGSYQLNKQTIQNTDGIIIITCAVQGIAVIVFFITMYFGNILL